MIRRNNSVFRIFYATKTFPNQFSTKIDIDKLEQENALNVDVLDEEAQKRELEIEKKRNKSRLTTAHRNILHDQKPYNESKFWSHDTIKYIRKVYGKYGQESGIDPSICWPTKQELAEKLDYEKVAYPFTVQQMMEKAKKDREEKEEKKAKRQQEVVNNMAKLELWKTELYDRIRKKEAEEMGAKERKNRLIEEVRRHFGYAVDPRDEKFKEMVEKKEKEQKKLMKEARKKAKEEKMLSKLLLKKSEEGETKPEENKNLESNSDKSVN